MSRLGVCLEVNIYGKGKQTHTLRSCILQYTIMNTAHRAPRQMLLTFTFT